jgi:2-polyprenyl-3-methyl-5-hydroxy-6-metoxy-1,4-benzoquinol methylase
MLNNILHSQNEFLLSFDHLPENEKINAVEAFIGKITPFIIAAEKCYSRDEIIESLSALRNKIRLAPIVRQSQDWPRGYQGDFEIIKYVLQHTNETPRGTLAFYVEEILLNGAICEQHRNKIKQQELLIRETVRSNDEAEIVSIGCGISEDMRGCLDEILSSRTKIRLLDVDEDALKYSSLQLADIAQQVDYMQGNIYKSILRLDGQYDLILLGGVCDYLNDNFLSAILKRLIRRLKPGGRMFFTNIKTGNPFRIYLEYLSNWILIERSEESILTMLDALVPQGMHYQFETDASGVTLMITINHPQVVTGKMMKEKNMEYSD